MRRATFFTACHSPVDYFKGMAREDPDRLVAESDRGTWPLGALLDPLPNRSQRSRRRRPHRPRRARAPRVWSPTPRVRIVVVVALLVAVVVVPATTQAQRQTASITRRPHPLGPG